MGSTLDCGSRSVDGFKDLVRIHTFPPHAQSAWTLCEERNLSGARDDPLSYVLDANTTFAVSGRELLTTLKTVSDSNSVCISALCLIYISVHSGPPNMNFYFDFKNEGLELSSLVSASFCQEKWERQNLNINWAVIM